MNQDQLEKSLREKLPAAAPRPGFETRIKALAREPIAPGKSRLFTRLALPALALLILALILAPKNEPITTPSVVLKNPNPAPSTKMEEPVSREYQGLKNDAQWTMSLFRNTLPSLPVSRKRESE